MIPQIILRQLVKQFVIILAQVLLTEVISKNAKSKKSK